MKARAGDFARYGDLAARASGGDPRACHKLVEALWPLWVDQVKNSRGMASLARSDDHVHNVVSRLVDKIGRDDGRGLRHYPSWQERHPSKTFGDWMRIVTANVVRDYVREQLGPRNSAADEPSPKRLLNEYSLCGAVDDFGSRPPVTLAQTARELLEFARSRLSAPQRKALQLWLEGEGFEDIDQELQVPAGQGRRVLRSAVAILRRHFAAAGEREPQV